MRNKARRIAQAIRQHQRYRRYAHLHRRILLTHPTGQLPWSVTCQGKADGGGAQWHACLSVLALSHHLGLSYHHTSFSQVEHAPHDPHPWLAVWNGLFRLESPAHESCGLQKIPCVTPLDLAQQILDKPPSAGGLFVLEHAHAITNRQPELLSSLRPRLRQNYRPRPQLAPPPLPLERTLVVHVRRGDVQASGPYQHRFTSAAAIAAICSRLQARHPQFQQVLLLSASGDPDLLELCRDGFLLDSHHDVFTHLHWMSQAAGLVMARSSLSYLAAMLNPNLVFYDRFEHPPLPDWIRLPRLTA